SSVVSLRLVLSNPTLPEIAGDNPVSYTTQRDTILSPLLAVVKPIHYMAERYDMTLPKAFINSHGRG
ncbi:hypothetical protein, partial [Rhizobium skierniewicense]|uniref:hypothetical protein n=1 Tax=Rhizobium skierniewicense TaxID=984260 RepID=UPI001AEE49B2